MFSLLRPRNRERRSSNKTPSPVAVRRPLLQDSNGRVVEDREGEQEIYDEEMNYDEDDDDDDDDDEDEMETPLLPIFASEHLDKLPLYNITHSCRILIVQKVETTLSWDQLRSPQISQFVVKPLQSQILAKHFNRATICALIANCLQFQKEAQTNPGNSGVSKTRAMVSELLAIRLLKEYSIRELIDALSYDFDPLEGIAPAPAGIPGAKARQHGRGARISTVEIAIRSQAKKFLAHPLVVQQLEAIWAGTIVFHSAADSLHRKPTRAEARRGRGGYGSIEQPTGTITIKSSGKKSEPVTIFRRSVTLYDPREASLFKLSRLRVPRYRQVFSTLSFAIMLGLFLAVLADRSVEITPLEVVFWFWSAGYMLDEVVGFSEQGFGLYIMSVWNAFDLGILLLFFVYYFLRLYGLLVPDARKHTTANMSYDVLASSAILLFPRLFSVLDHYKYFSQLLIAFRMMAQDMVAILVLIVICCSGFFVAFTLSFSDDKTDASSIAFYLFQLVMGFTPAAWELWTTYNFLGRSLLILFLFICHFLIVTILITVLTNSFMEVVRNANEEHQFLFAVNTISLVKSDALFSYIPPTNLFGWVATPFRCFMPFRAFVKANRTIIKVTHLPILFTIFTYERLFLASNAYEPTDLIERKPRMRGRLPAFSLSKNPGPFSPGNRLREPSIVSFRKERALDEVFRKPYQESNVHVSNPQQEEGQEDQGDRRRSSNVVGSWMRGVSIEGGASPPMEQPRSIVERLENRARPGLHRAQTSKGPAGFKRDFSRGTRSVISDPEDLSTNFTRPVRIEEETEFELSRDDQPQETDADGDDELLTNDEGDGGTVTGYEPADTPGVDQQTEDDNDDEDEDDGDDVEEENKENIPGPSRAQQDYFGGAVTPHLPGYGAISHATKARMMDANPRRNAHERQPSSQTILFSPVLENKRATGADSSSASSQAPRRPSRPTTARQSGTSTPVVPISAVRPKTPKPFAAAKPRPFMPARAAQQTMPNIHWDLNRGHPRSRPNRQPSFNAIALDLASDLGDNRYAPDPLSPGFHADMPASFSEQMLREQHFAREMERRREDERRRSEDEENSMVGRIMLARMNTLEEGFREVLREVKDLASVAGANSSRGGSEVGLRPAPRTGSSNQLAMLKTAAQGGRAAKAGKSPKKVAPSKKGKERFKESVSDETPSPVMEGVGGANEYEEDVSPGTMTIADLGIPTGNSNNYGARKSL